MSSAPEQRTERGPAEESPAEGITELTEEDLVACPEEPEWPDDGSPPSAGADASADAGAGTGAGADTSAGVNRLEIFGGSIPDSTGNIPGRPVLPHISLTDAMVHYYGDYVGTARHLHATHRKGRIDNESFDNTCRALQKFFLDNLRAIRFINDGPPEARSRVLTQDEKTYITEMCAVADRSWTKESTIESLRKMLKKRFP